VMRSARFQLGDYTTDFIDLEFPDRIFECPRRSSQSKRAAIAAVIYEYMERRKISMTIKRGPEGKNGWKQFYRGRAVNNKLREA